MVRDLSGDLVFIAPALTDIRAVYIIYNKHNIYIYKSRYYVTAYTGV